MGKIFPQSRILWYKWTLVWETGHETTNNRSHLQLIIYFWAEVWLVSDYANMNIFYIKASNQDSF